MKAYRPDWLALKDMSARHRTHIADEITRIVDIALPHLSPGDRAAILHARWLAELPPAT